MAWRRNDGARSGAEAVREDGGGLRAGAVVVVVAAVLAVAAAFVVAAAVTGCGGSACRAAGSAGAGRSRPAPGYLVSTRVPGPPGGSPGIARALGRRMLARLVLPAGARRVARQPWFKPEETIGLRDVTYLSAFYRVPLPLSELDGYLLAHAPAGMTRSGYGSTYGPVAADVSDMVSYALRKVPAWADQQTQLLVSAVPGRSGGTVLRVDAQVVWYAQRSAAQYLRPSAYRAVVVTAGLPTPASPNRYPTRQRTFTSPAALAALTGVLDGLHAQVGGALSCPAFLPDFRLSFVPRSGPPVVVTPAGCWGEAVTVGGRRQPMLADGSSMRLFRVIARLLRVRRGYW